MLKIFITDDVNKIIQNIIGQSYYPDYYFEESGNQGIIPLKYCFYEYEEQEKPKFKKLNKILKDKSKKCSFILDDCDEYVSIVSHFSLLKKNNIDNMINIKDLKINKIKSSKKNKKINFKKYIVKMMMKKT